LGVDLSDSLLHAVRLKSNKTMVLKCLVHNTQFLQFQAYHFRAGLYDLSVESNQKCRRRV